MEESGQKMANKVLNLALTWFQYFDHNTLVVQRVDTLIHLRILASANLLDNLEVVLGPIRN